VTLSACAGFFSHLLRSPSRPSLLWFSYYCSTLYAGLPGLRKGCLERVIRTAARFMGGIPRTDHVSAYMLELLDVLHWLPLHHRLMFRIGALAWRCLLGLAQSYLRDHCYPTPGTRGRCFLRSMERGVLFIPFSRTSTSQASAFSVVGPSVWNGLSLALRWLTRVHSDTFYSSLKTALFSRARVGSASE